MKKTLLTFYISVLLTGLLQAQSYPSLLWEITGNGLQKPSYLFGTMHVSNKMVFHLSDSFYNAIASCDIVSLEVDPKQWQPEMFRLQQSQTAMSNYTNRLLNEYIKDKSFRLTKNYEDRLKVALGEEPMQANGLLYRTYQGQSDFQENTYLDLYIYQTARKLGKQATGVENYIESEKLTLEAAEDMAKEKRKPFAFDGGENMFDIQKKIQDAYRRGDLDMLDSLSKLSAVSEAYNEKFLYKRNEIQANSIDSIVRQKSLFVGVGAAHLPGDRGVIELLRKKGYTLRPVRMADEDAVQREKIDKLKVPVTMKQTGTADGFIQLQIPGTLYKRIESFANDSWQYSDMENGAYYMLTRIKTHAAMLGQNEEDVWKKIDSTLYENIPGKILQKKAITRNGYKGFDITNKTRRGDIQRYHIFITPAEILLFKISGNDDYVTGKEADDFFASIRIKEAVHKWTNYAPPSGGFTVSLPEYPAITKDKSIEDRLDGWQYEARDAGTGDAYMITQKSINNYRFLEEDTLDLHLIEESVKSSDIIDKETTRKFEKLGEYPCLNMTFSLKDGSTLKTKAVIRGTQYYLLLVRSKDSKNNPSSFFNSFHFSGFNYADAATYTDSSLHFTVRTPVKPSVDDDLHQYIERSMYNPVLMRTAGTYISETKTRYACFKNDTTGEAIQVTVATLPAYFYRKDIQKFWENEMHWKSLQQDFILEKKEWMNKADSITGYSYTLLDTNSNRKIKGLVLVKGNTVYKLSSLVDNLSPESSFIRDFYASFKPALITDGYSMFESKTSLFLKNYNSKDSATHKIAREAISHVLFEGNDLGKIKQLIGKLKHTGKNYIDLKTKFILAIGRIADTVNMAERVGYLDEIYTSSTDTSSFQNAAVLALARTRSKESYAVLKKILTKSPVILETASEYNELFAHLRDSLALAKTLFPDILPLTAIEDYKIPLTNLLSQTVDSGYVKADDYASGFNTILFDAQIALRKLQPRNERDQENNKNAEENESVDEMLRTVVMAPNNSIFPESRINNYAILLAPFYNKNAGVVKFFDQLLANRDKKIKMNAAMVMVKNNIAVPDTVLTILASNDRYRALLLEKLEKNKKENLFPAAYKKQEDIAASLLLNATTLEKFSDLEPAGKQYVETKNMKGYVYFFKYKLQKKGDWLVGISGIQPKNTDEINSNRSFVTATNKKLKTDEPEQKQFEDKLQQMLLMKRKSAAQFYSTSLSMNMPLRF